jgi:hypothetical protein
VKPADSGAAPAPDKTPAPKKAYVKPSFAHERVFETMALACGKVNATQVQCKTNKKNS